MSLKCVLLIGCFFASLIVYSQNDIFNVARSGSVEEVKALMAINSDTINSVNDKGFMPLTLACYNGNEAVALFLIKQVKDINGDSKYGTPLMATVFRNHVPLTKVLLEHGANPNISDVNNTTPLHYAVLNKNETIIALLIDAKADSSLKDSRDKTALDYALMDSNTTIIELLVQK
ncbi:ankyrin repeat domain-containing protein [Xanthomarina sp. F2636L]|uniref:ankyrin repeat domain-containing protein n=1 Tax=Xanthomarina sp. F2636L TaxID=2996018 RepID=UPI00225E4043|nr:ankyrin repeat domain-containing protein [Xanthomarina sp. F2636L]MCX7550185.1 ankyrin repeat domain-containing protein [Xanthomarina sp. F2636L]